MKRKCLPRRPFKAVWLDEESFDEVLSWVIQWFPEAESVTYRFATPAGPRIKLSKDDPTVLELNNWIVWDHIARQLMEYSNEGFDLAFDCETI